MFARASAIVAAITTPAKIITPTETFVEVAVFVATSVSTSDLFVAIIFYWLTDPICRRAAIRLSIGGCVEKRLLKLPVRGLAM